MSFANLKALFLVSCVLFACFVFWFFAKHLQKRLEKWIRRKQWPQMIPDFRLGVFKRKYLFFTLGMLFLGISLLRPQLGEREEIIQSEGMDILFALDLSNSMLAEDTPPSRLNRAQSFIKKCLTNLADDRVGVIGFAGKAFLTVPLTTDFGYVAEMVDTLDPSAMLSQGTNIQEAINVSMKAFERGAEDNHKTSRAVILISDGEDFGADAMKAAEKLKDFGAGFFTVSVGTSEGAPIPLRNEAGVLQTYKKDRGEKTVLTRVNRELLSKVAESGGGSSVELVNPDDAAYTITKQLKGYNRDSKKDQRQVTKIDRYQYFLGIGIAFFLLSFFTGYQPLWIFIILMAPSFVQAQTLNSYINSKKAESDFKSENYDNSAKLYEEARKGDPENSALQFNEATALAKGKHPEDSIFNFNEASKKALSQGDYSTASRSLYNEGIVQSEQKNLMASYDRLTKSIELAKITHDEEAEKRGREALSTLIEKQKQQSQQDKQKNDSKEDKNSKNQSGQGKNDPQNPDDKNKNDQKKPEDGKNRQFKSGTLSKDVAESIMNDLSDREKQLVQRRLKDRKPKETQNDKDW